MLQRIMLELLHHVNIKDEIWETVRQVSGIRVHQLAGVANLAGNARSQLGVDNVYHNMNSPNDARRHCARGPLLRARATRNDARVVREVPL